MCAGKRSKASSAVPEWVDGNVQRAQVRVHNNTWYLVTRQEMGYARTSQLVALLRAVCQFELQLCAGRLSCPESGQVLEVLVDAKPSLLWGRPGSIWAEVISHDPGWANHKPCLQMFLMFCTWA